jgi:uncharacterized glyoxalase superfamily protein PhnB
MSSLFYDDAPAAIDWLCRAFGFEVRLRVEGEAGRIEYSELTFGEGLISVATGVGDKAGNNQMVSPRATGGLNTQVLCVYVDDVDAHYARARAAGAKIFREPSTSDYGEEYNSDRSYGAIDPEGHHWFFMRRVRDAKKNAK